MIVVFLSVTRVYRCDFGLMRGFILIICGQMFPSMFQLYMPCYTYQYTTVTLLKFPYMKFEYFFYDVFVQHLVAGLMKCKSHV